MEKKSNVHAFTKQSMSRISGVTLVEITGNSRVLIERHQGVLEYKPEKICVKATYGCVMIYGERLHLMQMTNSILVICGNIQSVSMQRRG